MFWCGQKLEAENYLNGKENDQKIILRMNWDINGKEDSRVESSLQKVNLPNLGKKRKKVKLRYFMNWQEASVTKAKW